MRVVAQKSSHPIKIIERKKNFLVVFEVPKKKEWHLLELEVQ